MKKKNEKTSEVVCKVIPLYKFEVKYEYEDSNKDEYEYIIISDNIKSLIQEIISRELILSMKDCRKYLSIRDFLLMPCELARNGYHLFDIDEQDLAVSYGYDTQEQYYKTVFKEKVPKPVDVKSIDNVLKAFEASVKELHKDDDQVQHMIETTCDAIAANALYESDMVKKGIEDSKSKQTDHNEKEFLIGIVAIKALIDKTG
jgi:hypothetical protein